MTGTVFAVDLGQAVEDALSDVVAFVPKLKQQAQQSSSTPQRQRPAVQARMR